MGWYARQAEFENEDDDDDSDIEDATLQADDALIVVAETEEYFAFFRDQYLRREDKNFRPLCFSFASLSLWYDPWINLNDNIFTLVGNLILVIT